MINVEEGIQKTWGEEHFDAITILRKLARDLAAERDKIIEFSVEQEVEWRYKNDWVGEKRPEEVRKWVMMMIEKKISRLGFLEVTNIARRRSTGSKRH